MKKPGASTPYVTPIPGWYQMSLKNPKIFGFIKIIKTFDAKWLEEFEENRLNGRKLEASFDDPHRKGQFSTPDTIRTLQCLLRGAAEAWVVFRSAQTRYRCRECRCGR